MTTGFGNMEVVGDLDKRSAGKVVGEKVSLEFLKDRDHL